MLAMTENVRGAVLPMGGVGGVASFPYARRKGHVRTMFGRIFELMHDRGDAVSTLYPFRESFYERLGYASMPQNRFVTVKPEQLTPILRLDLPGEVTQHGVEDCFDEWWAFSEQSQRERHGFALRERTMAERWRDDNEFWVAIVREEGAITGMMTFEITGYTQALRADTFYATTVAAQYQLLAWIARHVDQVSEAVIEVAADTSAELWSSDIGARTSTVDKNAWPAPQGRVISLEGLSGIGAGADARIAVRIEDGHCPWNNGVWTLEGDSGALNVSSGGDAACTLTINGLCALVWRGADPGTFRYRGWGDPDAGAQKTLQALFPPAVPILHEQF